MANPEGDFFQSSSPPPSGERAEPEGLSPLLGAVDSQTPSAASAPPAATAAPTGFATESPQLTMPAPPAPPAAIEQIVLGHASQGPAVQVEGANLLISPYIFDFHLFTETNNTMGRGPTAEGKPDHRAKLVDGFWPRLTVSGTQFKRKLMPAYFPLSRYSRPEDPGTTSPSISQVKVELKLDVINLTVKEYETRQPPQSVVLRGVSALMLQGIDQVLVVLKENINIEPGDYSATLKVNGEWVNNFPWRVVIQQTRENNINRIDGAIRTISRRLAVAGPYDRPDSPSSSPRSRRRRQTTTSPASVEASPDPSQNYFSPASSATASSSAHSSPTMSQLDLADSLAGFSPDLGSLDMSLAHLGFNMQPPVASHAQMSLAHSAGAQTVSSSSTWVQQTSASPVIPVSNVNSAHSAPMQSPATAVSPDSAFLVALNVIRQHGFDAVPGPYSPAPSLGQAVRPAVVAQVPGHVTSVPMVPMWAQPQQSYAFGPFGNFIAHQTPMPGPSYTKMVANQSFAPLAPNLALSHTGFSMSIPAQAQHPGVQQDQVAPPMEGDELSRILGLHIPDPNGPVCPDSNTATAVSNYAVQAWPPQASASLDPASGFEDLFSSAPSLPTAQPDGTEYLDLSFLEQPTSAAGLAVSTGDREYQDRLIAGFSSRSQQQG